MSENRGKFKTVFISFSRKFWYVPSDVIQRSLEANIWTNYLFKSPILEIGCGDGKISKLVFLGISQIDYGLDIDSNAVEIARNCGFYKEVVCSDSAHLPFKNGSFRSVIANSTFEHIENLDSSLNEVYRVLKKDGIFVFNVPSAAFKLNISVNYGSNRSDMLDKRLSHINYFTSDEWLKKLKFIGFNSIKTKEYFSSKVLDVWYRLFKIYTFKIGNSELWSLIKNYLGNKFYIKNLHISILERQIAQVIMKNEKIGEKMMIFISARK